MKWIAYCTECNKELDRMQNGSMAEAAGRIHSRKTGHDVIVGYDPAEIEEAVAEQCEGATEIE